MSSVHLFESALRRAGLDYYLVGGRAFFAQQEIHDLHNLLMALENPLDDLSLAGALRSPFFCLSDEALFALCRHRAGLWSALGDEHAHTLLPADQVARCRRAHDHLRAWREQKDLLPIARLIDRILADTGYDAALQLEFLGERKLANLWKLLDIARTFDRSGLFGLAEFAARLGDLIAAQPREEQAATQPENADVVRLMTIHQAKGLEFPVVFVPDLAATGGARHTPTAAWDARLGCVARPPADEDPPPFAPFGGAVRQAGEDLEEWAEDIRTLYVACTRPRDYLVLSAALPADYRPAGPWMQTLAARFDLPSGECRGRGEGVRVGGVTPMSQVAKAEPSRPTPTPPPAVVHRRGTASVGADELARRVEGDDLFGEEASAEGMRLRRLLDACDFRAGPFAGSALGERLARARGVRRRVEFACEGEPGVHGTADCVFEDEDGWHLVEWVVEPVPAGGQEGYARRRGPILALAASALGVRSAIVAFAREGTFVERAAGRLARAGDAERVRRTLAAMAGEGVSVEG